MRAQRPGESALLLLDAIDILVRHDVPYAVVGAMAASVHGVVRASLDADAILGVHSDALAAIERRFRESGMATELRYGDAADPISAVLTLTDQHSNRVDFIVGIRGLDPEAFSRALEVPFYGQRLRVISLEDFVAMKLFAHGPQDVVADATAALEAAECIDVALLGKLSARFGPDTAASLESLLGNAKLSR
jgi:hypothetical protein